MAINPVEILRVVQKEVRLGDPHVNSDDRNNLSILFNIYESLVTYGPEGSFRPVLAESWTLDEDACTWTFTLRESVKFHDGSHLTAGDVLASLERVLDPQMAGELGTHSLYRSYLGDANIQALDSRTVRIRTAQPLADLLDLMVKFPIIPENALGGLPGQPVGSGPYRFVEHESGRIVLESNTAYWRGAPPVKKVTWTAVSDAEERLACLVDGRADLSADIIPRDYQTLLDKNSVDAITAPSNVCTIFMCNIQRGVCGDVRVRQALNYALDKSAIIEKVMNGYATPLNGPLAKMHLGYDPHTNPYPYDVEKAKALLAEAGYPEGLKIVLDVPSILPDEAAAVAREMKTQYSKAGIDTEIRVFSDRPAYANMVRNKAIDDACAFDSSPLSTYQIFVDKFHSGLHGAWWQGYTNPDVDDLIDRARKTVDYSERKEIYRQAYRILHQDAPWIYLFNATLIWGFGSKAAGWDAIHGQIDLAGSWLNLLGMTLHLRIRIPDTKIHWCPDNIGLWKDWIAVNFN